uniref:Uncharacterized protein n=1 Tax=Pipistrellus kuhlii TaxID=59472 RepID=A0A7J7VN52_PIPKU|nr:hypothetical protein mPipKuh1_008426 [Pipistrellus kuhlii]
MEGQSLQSAHTKTQTNTHLPRPIRLSGLGSLMVLAGDSRRIRDPQGPPGSRVRCNKQKSHLHASMGYPTHAGSVPKVEIVHFPCGPLEVAWGLCVIHPWNFQNLVGESGIRLLTLVDSWVLFSTLIFHNVKISLDSAGVTNALRIMMHHLRF